jgi:hypothetical protein
MTNSDQQHPKKKQVNRHVTAADLVGDGRVDLYAGFSPTDYCSLSCWGLTHFPLA